MLEFTFWTLVVIFIIVCLFMILLVLIQKGRGGGLASAFGGGGGNTAFGSKTGDVLTWATSIVFGVFLVLAVSLNLLANHRAQVPANPPPAVNPLDLGPESTTPATRPTTPPVTGATQPAVAPTTVPATVPSTVPAR